ncbi:hypothetical protein C482_14514 [Natrialba chahannaoensis JCM 10990]|uniref:Uncharacterized protein n=1 Tax=Natrialba chahannaoensis JCM 10990 TaxID=1227492 RepID=M0AGJ8_9EURY|nr:hypothetical protein [Natrialba chahannaoensis]ELY96992.1 hypothetical protein C482_14514 [Natrialba chahannaoensis JCM 10990]
MTDDQPANETPPDETPANDSTAADGSPEAHLREALRHLDAARDTGELRKTHTVALEEVARTITTVLREHETDGNPEQDG